MCVYCSDTAVILLCCVDAGDREQAGAQTSGETHSPPSPMPIDTAVVEDKATNLASSSGREQKGPSPLRSPPSRPDFLNKVAAKIPAKWRLFAYSLYMVDDTLDAIELKSHDPTECFMRVFGAWEKNPSQPFTWEMVIEILQSESVGEVEMAKNIRQCYIRQ